MGGTTTEHAMEALAHKIIRVHMKASEIIITKLEN